MLLNIDLTDMKTLIPIIAMLLSTSLHAELKLESIKPDPEIISYSKVQIPGKGDFFLVSKKHQSKLLVDVYGTKGLKEKIASLDLPGAAIFMAPSIDANLIVASDASGEWHASTIDADLKIKHSGRLQKFSSVVAAINTPTGYLVSGQDRDGFPRIAQLDHQLVPKAEKSFTQSGPGEARLIGVKKDRALAVFNFESGRSQITALSGRMDILESIPVSGSATSAIELDVGYLAVYSAKNEVFAERLGQKGESIWKLRLFERRNTSGLRFHPYQNETGFSVVGFNDGSAIVVNVTKDKKINHLHADPSRLGMPTDSTYAVLPNANRLHLFGIAVPNPKTSAAKEVLFHLSAPRP